MASGIVRSDSTVETITLTKTSNATSATLVCQRYGKLCVVYVKSATMASSCTGTYRYFPIATGCPIPIGRTAINSKILMGSIVYFTE